MDDEKNDEKAVLLKDNINENITKKSLSLKFISDRNISQYGLRSMPISKVSGKATQPEAINE